MTSEEFVRAMRDRRPLLQQPIVQQALEMADENPWTRLRRLHAELLAGGDVDVDEETFLGPGLVALTKLAADLNERYPSREAHERPRLTLIEGGRDDA